MRALLLLTLVFAYAYAYVDDDVDYRNYTVIHAVPTEPGHVEVLTNLETEHSVDLKLDFWNHAATATDTDGVHIGVPAEYVESLRSRLWSAGIPNFVKINDFQQNIDQEQLENPRQFSPFSASSRAFANDQYHRFEEIVAYMKQLVRDYPSLVKIQLVGHSGENREINGVQIGINSNSQKPIFYLDAGIHAREWVAPATALYIINELVTKANTDAAITSLLTKYDFFIIPVVNPDGYVYTWGGHRNWRKNRSRPQPFSGCYGVDPNRNFDAGFGGASTSQNPCSDLYPGPNAFSEAESRAVKKYTDANSGRIKITITLHSFGQMWMSPWGYVAHRPSAYATMLNGAKVATTALTAKYGTRFKIGSIYEVIYPTGGGSIDWQYMITNAPYTYAVELRDTGIYGFQLPRQFIVPTALETWAGLQALAKLA